MITSTDRERFATALETVRGGIERADVAGPLGEREVQRHLVRGFVGHALLECRAVAGGEQREAQADDEEGDSDGRA